MKIHFIETGTLKLDGGAMFGVVPKRLWEKLNPPDESNMCTWAMRCLVVETAGRNILIDTGIGTKQDARFRSHFSPAGQEHFLEHLAAAGFSPESITDVLLTHLHFDHVGGALLRSAEGELVPAFPRATYWSNEIHWNWALNPNPREAASFLAENFVPLQEQGRLQFVNPPSSPDEDVPFAPGIQLRWLYGHTEAMMMPILSTESETLVYCADLIPSVHHVGLPYVMAYDVRPLVTLQEKARLLKEAAAGQFRLLFEHDPRVPEACIQQDERGRLVAVSTPSV
ncbi:MAG: MBL fold metallo-hydrolase [Lewinellaceae bacterium]|nr:MBL fold metallo-hydrolase [Lewinellaceae bacterium]